MSTNPGQGWAWRFHYAVRELKRAYQAARATADADIETINKKAEEHSKLVEAGKASWTEYDEDGYPAYDYGEHLGEEMYDAEQVLNLVRLAFVISLHHLVEIRIADKLPNKKYDQAKAFVWLKGFGWTPDEDGLNALRLAANCAKHSSGSSAQQLYAVRQDMFDTETIQKWGSKPSYETLKLTDDHVEDFFKSVANSVPKMPPAF